MQAKSQEHRRLILEAVQKRTPYTEICKTYGVNKNTITKIKRQSQALQGSDVEITAATNSLNLSDVPSCAYELSQADDVVMLPEHSRRWTHRDTARFHREPETMQWRIWDARKHAADAPTRHFVFFQQSTDHNCDTDGHHTTPEESKPLAGWWVRDDEHINAVFTILRSFTMPIPKPQKGGGGTASALNLEQKVMLIQVLSSTRLSLENAADYIRLHVDPKFPRVSAPTLHKVAKAMGIRHLHTKTFDPKTMGDAARELERHNFMTEMTRGVQGSLRGECLIFQDETNISLNLNHYAGKSNWSVPDQQARFPSKKGKSQYISLNLTVGLMFGADKTQPLDQQYAAQTPFKPDPLAQHKWNSIRSGRDKSGRRFGAWAVPGQNSHLLIFWELIPPKRQLALGLRYEENSPMLTQEKLFLEKTCKRFGVRDNNELLREIRNLDLGEKRELNKVIKLLTFMGVEHRVIEQSSNHDGQEEILDRTASRDELIERVKRTLEGDRQGLPRRFIGPRYRGGPLQSELSTTSTFMAYVKALATYIRAAFGERVLADTRLFTDNASTHGTVRVDTHAAGFVHKFATSLGFEGVVFSPVRAPQFSVAEILFAFLKSFLANIALPPSTGEHRADAMMMHVENSLLQITPAMVAAWTVSRGYHFGQGTPVPVAINTVAINPQDGDRVYAQQRSDGSIVEEPPVRLTYRGGKSQDTQDNTELMVAARAMVSDLQRAAAQVDIAAFRKHLPIYETTYKLVGRFKGTEQIVATDMLRAVLLHFGKQIDYAAHSRHELCLVGLDQACPDTPLGDGRVALCGQADFDADVICMNQQGEVVTVDGGARQANTTAARARIRLREYSEFAQIGDLERIMDATAQLVATADPSGGGTLAKSIIRLAKGKDAQAALKPFADAVDKYTRTGELRPKAPPCSVLVRNSDKGTLKIMLNNWNAWKAVTGSGNRHALVDLQPDEHPYYTVKMSEVEFDRRNIWGKMQVRIAKLGLYQHVGGQLHWSTLKRIAISRITDHAQFGAQVRVVKPATPYSFHLAEADKVRPAQFRQLVAPLDALATQMLKHPTSDKSLDSAGAADHELLAIPQELETLFKQASRWADVPAHLLPIWEMLLGRIHAGLQRAQIRFKAEDKELLPRKLRQLLLDMHIPRSVLAVGTLASNVARERNLPILDPRTARTMLFREERLKRNPPKGQRWPGYPISTYTRSLLVVRDFLLGLGDDLPEKVKNSLQHCFHTRRFLLSSAQHLAFPGGFTFQLAARPTKLNKSHSKPVAAWASTQVLAWNTHMITDVVQDGENFEYDLAEEAVLTPTLPLCTVSELRADRSLALTTATKVVQLYVNTHAEDVDALSRQYAGDITSMLDALLRADQPPAPDDMLVFTPAPIGGTKKSKLDPAAQTTIDIIPSEGLLFPNHHAMETAMRVGMPLNFAVDTVVRSVPDHIDKPIKAYTLAEMSRHRSSELLSTLAMSLRYQLDSLRPQTKQETTAIRELGKAVDSITHEFRKIPLDVVEYLQAVRNAQTTVFRDAFVIGPDPTDFTDYFVIKSEAESGVIRFDLLYTQENQDEFTAALVQVAQRREAQRDLRKMRLIRELHKGKKE